MTKDEVISNIEEGIGGVKRAETASGNVEKYSLKEQMAAAEYLDKKKAVQESVNNGRNILWGGLGRLRKHG